MLDDRDSYPGFVVEGNLNADPGFNADIMGMIDGVMSYCKANRGGTEPPQSHYYYGPGNPPLLFPPVWPLPEDLSYSNTDLLTAGTDGLPLGDLNWFPDKKEVWITKVEPASKSVPTDFELSQNYQNNQLRCQS